MAVEPPGHGVGCHDGAQRQRQKDAIEPVVVVVCTVSEQERIPEHGDERYDDEWPCPLVEHTERCCRDDQPSTNREQVSEVPHLMAQHLTEGHLADATSPDSVKCSIEEVPQVAVVRPQNP